MTRVTGAGGGGTDAVKKANVEIAKTELEKTKKTGEVEGAEAPHGGEGPEGAGGGEEGEIEFNSEAKQGAFNGLAVFRSNGLGGEDGKLLAGKGISTETKMKGANAGSGELYTTTKTKTEETTAKGKKETTTRIDSEGDSKTKVEEHGGAHHAKATPQAKPVKQTAMEKAKEKAAKAKEFYKNTVAKDIVLVSAEKDLGTIGNKRVESKEKDLGLGVKAKGYYQGPSFQALRTCSSTTASRRR